MATQPPADRLSTPDDARPWLPVWLPWLLAPCFLFLPIGGCGVAAAIRQPRLARMEAPPMDAAVVHPPLVPVGTVVTVAPPPRF